MIDEKIDIAPLLFDVAMKGLILIYGIVGQNTPGTWDDVE